MQVPWLYDKQQHFKVISLSGEKHLMIRCHALKKQIKTLSSDDLNDYQKSIFSLLAMRECDFRGNVRMGHIILLVYGYLIT